MFVGVYFTKVSGKRYWLSVSTPRSRRNPSWKGYLLWEIMPKLAGENCPVSRQHRSSIGNSIPSFIITGEISEINISLNIEAVKILCYRNDWKNCEHISKILGNYFLVVYARHIWMSFIILSVLIHRYCGKRYNLGKSAGLVAEMMRLPSYLIRYVVPNVSIIVSSYPIIPLIMVYDLGSSFTFVLYSASHRMFLVLFIIIIMWMMVCVLVVVSLSCLCQVLWSNILLFRMFLCYLSI